MQGTIMLHARRCMTHGSKHPLPASRFQRKAFCLPPGGMARMANLPLPGAKGGDRVDEPSHSCIVNITIGWHRANLSLCVPRACLSSILMNGCGGFGK